MQTRIPAHIIRALQSNSERLFHGDFARELKAIVLLLKCMENRELELSINESEHFNAMPLRDVLREVYRYLESAGVDALHDDVYDMLPPHLHARPYYAHTLQVRCTCHSL